MKNGTTTVTDTSHVALGTVMKDEATLGGTQPFAPTGAVTFTFSGGALGANAATDATFYATSANTAALAAQVAAYSFSATYAGDSNYNAILASAVNSETFFVDKGCLTLSLTDTATTEMFTVSLHVALRTVMKDEATLGGTQPFAPTGAVTFTFSGGALGANAATDATFYATSAN